MSRSHARVLTTIWQDDDFRALSGRAQRLYLLLLSQPDMTYCGVLGYRPKRWARLAGDSTVDGVEKAIGELEQAAYVIVDRETEELAVRTFARHDGVLDNLNTRKAFWRTLADVLSQGLREPLIAALPEGLREPSPPDEEKGSANPKSKPGGRGEGGISSRSSSRNSVGASTNGQVAKTKRGSQVPDPFDVTAEMRSWALNNVPGVNLEWETAKLVDWAKAEAKTKVSWLRTWQNWMRRAYEDGRTTRSNGHHDDPTLDRGRVFQVPE